MEEITKCQEEAENAAAPLSLPDDNGLTILRLSDNCRLPTKTRLNSSGGGMYSVGDTEVTPPPQQKSPRLKSVEDKREEVQSPVFGVPSESVSSVQSSSVCSHYV